jgi:hypothetical protein
MAKRATNERRKNFPIVWNNITLPVSAYVLQYVLGLGHQQDSVKPLILKGKNENGGERGIRTPGGV